MTTNTTRLREQFDMVHQLIQEAKGEAGPGSATDHLDAAENWLDKIEKEVLGA